MSVERKIPCPLCQIPVRPSAFGTTGVCPMCEDSRRDAKRETRTAAVHVDAEHERLASEKHKMIEAHKVLAAKRQEKVEEQQVIKAEKARLSEIHKEQASKELARRSLLHYTERKNPKYDPSWAHELVASQIEEFYHAIERKESPRMIITLPSRFGKSELASISGPGWALGHWPYWKFVLASYSDNLPMDFSRNIRDQLQSPDFKGLFPSGARLSPTDASAQAWSTVQGGALRAIGVGGGLLGFGCDCLVVDDPVKSTEEAHSPQALDKLWQWFSSVAYSRLLPGGGILVIQQRMAVDDLVGRLLVQQREEEKRLEDMRRDIELLKAESPRGGNDSLEREIQLLEEEADELDASMDRWRYLEYPALTTQDEYYDKKVGEIMRVPGGFAPEQHWKPLRKRGDALHEKRYSRSYLLKLKRANPKMFQAMYMLNPILDEGAYFGAADFQRYERGKHPKLIYGHVFCAWDLAIGTKQSNDYTVGVAGMLDWEGKLWLLDIIRGKFGDVRQVADLVIDLHQKWGASMTGIEHTHVSMALGPILKTRMTERDAYIVLAEGKEKLVPTADKAVRARQLQGLCRGAKFYVPTGEEFDEFISELTRFQSGGHDDSVDAASWLAILALRNPPPRKPGSLERAAEKARSWLAELMDEIIEGDRGESSYMES